MTLVKQWLDALRSGKYRQGDGVLRTFDPEGDKFCCLGVLCDVAGLEWTLVPGYEVYSVPNERGGTYVAFLPDDLADQAGISSDFQHTLSRLNDCGTDFATIADVIEKGLT